MIYAPTYYPQTCPNPSPCDPCKRADCPGSFLQTSYDAPPSGQSQTYLSASVEFGDYLLCNPAFFLGSAAPGNLPISSFANPYFPGPSANYSAFADLANTGLPGSWDIKATFQGMSDEAGTSRGTLQTVYTIHTAVSYSNQGDPQSGPWVLNQINTPSPAPQTLTFDVAPSGSLTETGWPWPGSIDPDYPPYTWQWTITGSYQTIVAYPGNITIAPEIADVTVTFRGSLPSLYVFQGNCIEYDVYSESHYDTPSGQLTKLYPMAGSFASATSEQGITPVRCRSTAMEIFCPGSGTYCPDVNTDGSFNPPSLPSSITITIAPEGGSPALLSFTGAPVLVNPMLPYGAKNHCQWSITWANSDNQGDDQGQTGAGAIFYLEALVTNDLIALTDDKHWLDMPWAAYISWFAAPIYGGSLRRSKMGHRLPLIRRFQVRRL